MTYTYMHTIRIINVFDSASSCCSARRTLNLNSGSQPMHDSDIPEASASSSTRTIPASNEVRKCSSSESLEITDHLASRNSLSKLQLLMEESEKTGMFGQQTFPPQVLSLISDQNLQLYRNVALYHESYFDFTFRLLRVAHDSAVHDLNADGPLSEETLECAAAVTQFGLSFLFNTYLRLHVSNEIEESSCISYILLSGCI